MLKSAPMVLLAVAPGAATTGVVVVGVDAMIAMSAGSYAMRS